MRLNFQGYDGKTKCDDDTSFSNDHVVHLIKKNIIMEKNNVVFTPDHMLGSEAFRQATNFIKISDKFYYC